MTVKKTDAQLAKVREKIDELQAKIDELQAERMALETERPKEQLRELIGIANAVKYDGVDRRLIGKVGTMIAVDTIQIRVMFDEKEWQLHFTDVACLPPTPDVSEKADGVREDQPEDGPPVEPNAGNESPIAKRKPRKAKRKEREHAQDDAEVAF